MANNEVLTTCKKLLDVSKDLEELSTSTPTKEKIQELQGIQKATMQKLQELLQTAKLTAKEQKTLDDSLAQFKQHNENFITNLRIRSGIIAEELTNLKKSKKSLDQVRDTYVSKENKSKSPLNKVKVSAKGKRKIDTTS